MPVPPVDPNCLQRALLALDSAVARAKGNHAQTILCAPPEDFLGAVQTIPAEVRRRLDDVLMAEDPEAGLDALLESGALQAILPEVAALVGFGDGEWRHKDVWKHTKQVVAQSVVRLDVRWAALLHDVGKVRTRTISPDGEVHFFGHAELGARMFDKMERRMGLFRTEPDLRASIRFLILHHLRANQYDAEWTDSAVRRFARELGAELDNLLLLAQADITTKRAEKRKRGLRQIDELGGRIRDLAAQDAVQPPLPGGVGNLIMEAFGLPPSRLIGDIKRALEDAVDKGELPPGEPGEFYVEFIRANAERFGIPK
ncbi:MAG: HDIG domain-containing protein [Deltaproteobacteria bacterium]|nr:HDIG domain-containing protein [Deltaproteobacteria bacterium]